MARILPRIVAHVFVCAAVAATSAVSAYADHPLDNLEAADDSLADTVTTMEGLRYIDVERGTGAKVEPGMTVTVDYAGFLANGRLFDTSIDSVAQAHGFDRGGYPFEPITFTAGKGQVIQGWDIGLTTDMYVGGKRRLIIPPDLGYGAYGSGHVIPPYATLIFDVEVLQAQ